MQHSFWQDFLVRRELFNQLNLLDLVVMGETQEYTYIHLVQKQRKTTSDQPAPQMSARVPGQSQSSPRDDHQRRQAVSNSLDIRCEADVNK